jgi:hypothetical protein
VPNRTNTLDAASVITGERMSDIAQRLRIAFPGAPLAFDAAAEIERLQALVRTMLEEDPNELCADGGVTVLDVWRKEAKRALAGKEKEQ